jgi:hypothetical protein
MSHLQLVDLDALHCVFIRIAERTLCGAIPKKVEAYLFG